MTALYYVMGASGAGKDTLMSFARSNIEAADRLVFAHRYITRPADAGGENHLALSEAEFERRRAFGLFCMNWDSHGYRYGVGIEVETWMDSGLSVVVNGSRKYLPSAMNLFPNLSPVLITVSSTALRSRLQARGRESEEEIESRIQRSQEIQLDCPAAIKVSNDGEIEEGGARFLNALRGLATVTA